MFQQLPSYRHMLRTWQQQDLRRGPNRHPSSPKLSPGPKTREDSGKEAIVLYSEVICHSSSPTPEKRWKGRRVRGDGRRINNFLAEVWPSPLNTEPICPTVFEITPPDGQKGVSIVTCTFVQQAVDTGPCNSNQNSLFCDREVGRECSSL